MRLVACGKRLCSLLQHTLFEGFLDAVGRITAQKDDFLAYNFKCFILKRYNKAFAIIPKPFASGKTNGILLLLQSQVSQDVPGQMFVDLAMPENRLLLPRLWIHVDVVFAAGAEKDASLLPQSAKQLSPFHVMTTSRIWYFSGTSSNAISIYASRMFRSNSSSVRPCVMISGCSSNLPSQNFLLFQ